VLHVWIRTTTDSFNYPLGASYCRKTFLKGGVSIFVYRSLKYNTINTDKYNIDKDIEACAIQLDWTFNKLCILAIYRSPWGDFTNFLKQLDLILQKLYNNKYNIIICGDVNVNYLIYNNQRSQLDAVLHSYNLAGYSWISYYIWPEFPNCHRQCFHWHIHHRNIRIIPFINGLSDHDAQLLILSKGEKKEKECHTYMKRKINKYTIADFQLKLSNEMWEQALTGAHHFLHVSRIRVKLLTFRLLMSYIYDISTLRVN